MTKSELVAQLAKQFPALKGEDVRLSLDAILDAVAESLCAGRRCEIRGFGCFTLDHRAPRIGRNPKTGVLVQVPGKSVPRFKTSKELNERLNGGEVVVLVATR